MTIHHDEKKRTFSTKLESGEAYIAYEKSKEGALDLQHTIVPPEHEGKGVASALVKHVLEHARANDLRIIPSCPFIDSYVEKHPEYRDLVAE